jgi:hypothetical protein
MAAKRLNLPPVPSMVTSFPRSNAPLPTPVRWWRHPSSSPSSLARVEDDGRDVHRCSCRVGCHVGCRVVFVRHPESPLLPPPPLPPLNHQRAVAIAIAVATSIAIAVETAFNAGITSALISLLLSPPSSTQLSPRRRIDDANSLNAAIAGCHQSRGHRRLCCLRHCICCSHRCRHRCHHRHSLQNTTQFSGALKKIWGNFKTSNPTKLPVSKTNSAQ